MRISGRACLPASRCCCRRCLINWCPMPVPAAMRCCCVSSHRWILPLAGAIGWCGLGDVCRQRAGSRRSRGACASSSPSGPAPALAYRRTAPACAIGRTLVQLRCAAPRMPVGGAAGRGIRGPAARVSLWRLRLPLPEPSLPLRRAARSECIRCRAARTRPRTRAAAGVLSAGLQVLPKSSAPAAQAACIGYHLPLNPVMPRKRRQLPPPEGGSL